MAGFIDLSPAVGTVKLRDGVEMPCPGLSLGEIGRLIKRFPELAKMLEGGVFDWPALFQMSDDVIPAVIAAGFGYPADEKQEAAIEKNLSTAEKVVAVKAIWDTSVGPLVDALSDMATELSAAQKPPAAPSQKSSTKSTKPRTP